jgi:hypothetical protein
MDLQESTHPSQNQILPSKQKKPKAARTAEFKKKKNAQKHASQRDPVRDAAREVVNKRIATGIKKRFGLPDDCTVFRVPQFGQRDRRKDRVVTFGTVVLVNLSGNKLICVARFNIEVMCIFFLFTHR